MRFRRILVGLLALALTSCVNPPYVPTPIPPNPPGPTPEPTPTPTPVPEGHVVTQAEYDAVVPGTTIEAQLLTMFGPPRLRSNIGSVGTVAWVYDAKGIDGAALIAEFWVSNGKVINKNLL
jgi:outer membrane protein assembly factor BamE (lipoprotein component of BamABCDE complex)